MTPRRALLLLLCPAIAGCGPAAIPALVMTAAVAAATYDPHEISDFELVNEHDHFYREADHFDYHGTEVYEWRNCGEVASIGGEATPSCPNEIHVAIFDAEGARVFENTFHAGHCDGGRRLWDPVTTAAGAPGLWRIEMTFDIECVHDCVLQVDRVGPPLIEVTTSEGEGGEHDRSFVTWESECTYDRTVEEAFPLTVDCEAASVSVAWETIESGTMRVKVKDAEGEVVYDRTFGPGDSPPILDETGGGHAGQWTVKLISTDLTSTGLTITVESPPTSP